MVTLGTLALFRGMALIVLGPTGVSDFPPAFTELGFGHVPGTDIPWPFVVFLALAVTLGFVLHRDPDTYRYIPESIRRYPGAPAVCSIMREVGFEACEYIPVLGGLMAIHRAARDSA